jgi:23S rRNA pseudouridine2605 synthase
VTVRGLPAPEKVEQLRQGLELPDGLTRPVKIDVLKQRVSEMTCSMVLTEGRNRQIRRMWSAVGHRVKRLVRVAIGAYELGELPAGATRELSGEDIRRLTMSMSEGPQM